MNPSVTRVAPQDNFVLALEFDNGEERVLDMKPYLDFGVFRRLQSQEFFNQVRISFDTLEWPAGIDLDPEFVYQKSTTTRRSTECQ
jgi:hypothetical protein